MVKHFGHRFDWFLGVEAQVVSQEKKKARVCFVAYMLTLIGLVLAETGLPGQCNVIVGAWVLAVAAWMGYVVHLLHSQPALFG